MDKSGEGEYIFRLGNRDKEQVPLRPLPLLCSYEDSGKDAEEGDSLNFYVHND
jgi:hypothetical protein